MTRPESERGADKFLAYFEEIKKAHRATLGLELEMYKATERACLAEAFDKLLGLATTGEDFLAEAIHGLVWGQCLGNGNHRTTLLFVGRFLLENGIPFHEGSAAATEPATERLFRDWIERSKAVIRRRGEPGFAQYSLEPRHRKYTVELVAALRLAQSGNFTKIGAQRLIYFISSSEMSGF